MTDCTSPLIARGTAGASVFPYSVRRPAWKLSIGVSNARCACASVPRALIDNRFGGDCVICNPLASNHALTASNSDAVGPNRFANCVCVR